MHLCYIDEKLLKYDLQQHPMMCLKDRKELVSILTFGMDPNLYLTMWVLEEILCIQSVIMALSFR